MIGLDTNVLLAWLLAGPSRPLPAASSYRLSTVVVAELVWVLARSFNFPRDRIGDVLQDLLDASNIVFDRREVVEAALADYRRSTADFADYLIAHDNQVAGCRTTYTLDKAAARHPGFTLHA